MRSVLKRALIRIKKTKGSRRLSCRAVLTNTGLAFIASLFYASTIYSDGLITLAPGYDAYMSWSSPQRVDFVVDNPTGLPVVIEIQPHGFEMKLSNVSLLGRSDLKLESGVGSLAAEYLTLTVEEAPGFKFSLEESEFTNSVGGYQIKAYTLPPEQPYLWQIYRWLTLANLKGSGEPEESIGNAFECGDGASVSDRERSYQCLLQVVQGAEASGNTDLEIAAKLGLGQLEGNDGNSIVAEEHYRDILDTEGISDYHRILAADKLIGILQSRSDDEEKIWLEDMTGRLRVLVASEPDQIGYQYGLLAAENLACLYQHYRFQLTEAEACYKALIPRVSSGQDSLSLNLRNNLGGIQYLTGQVAEAEATWQRLLDDYPRLKKAQRLLYMQNRALAAWRQRKLGDAIARFEELRPLALEESEHNIYLRSSYYLARIFIDLGRPGRASSMLDAVDVSANRLGAKNWNYFVANLRAKLEEIRGDREQALNLYLAAEQMAIDNQLDIALAEPLLRVAEISLESGDIKQAEQAISRMTGIPEIENISRTRAYYHFLYGRMKLLQSEFLSAKEILDQAEHGFKEVGDSYWEALSRSWHARAVSAGGDYQTALAMAESAITQANGLRDEVLSLDLRAGYSQQQRQIYESGISINLAAWRSTGDEKYAIRAFELAEDSKAQTLKEILKADRQGYALSDELREERGQLVSALNGASVTRSLNADRQNDSAVTDEVNKNYFALLRVLENFDQEYGINPISSQTVATKLEDVSKEIGANELILSYFLLGSSILRFELTQDDFKLVETPVQAGKTSTQNLLDGLRRPGGYRLASYRESKRRLSRQLLPAFENYQQSNKISISGDSWVWAVPFAVLSESDSSQSDLIDRVELQYLPSLTRLSGVSDKGGSKDNSKVAIVFADPVFSPNDDRLTLAEQARQEPALPLDRLRGTGAEAAWLMNKDHFEVRALVGVAANREQFLELNSVPSDVLHIATHGLFNSWESTGGGLALSRFDDDGQPRDWFISHQDIAGLQLNVDLVFMSACEAALGEQISGEGVVGLTRAFHYSGARNVISSNWKVADRGTLEFVKHFYDHYAESGGDVAYALTRAARILKGNPRYRDPYYWSGFALHGSNS